MNVTYECIANQLCDNSIGTHYKAKPVDYKKELHRDWAAQWFLDNFGCLAGIEALDRRGKKQYNLFEKHKLRLKDFDPNERHKPEHQIEYALFGAACDNSQYVIPGIGQILDHQVPFKDKGSVVCGGPIDLMSFEHKTNTLFLLELKKSGKDGNSLLHCVLEAYTYFKRIKEWKRVKNEFNIPEETKVCICPLFFRGSNQADQLQKLTDKLYLLFDRINKDMQTTLHTEECCLAFAEFNQMHGFSMNNLPRNLTANVTFFDEIMPKDIANHS